MKDNIKKELKQLIGLELTRTTRTGATECLKFGTLYKIDHKGIERQVGKFGLHLQCPWRITQNNIILVGDNDLYEHPSEAENFDSNFDWDVPNGNLRDVKLSVILKSKKNVVEFVYVDEYGGFELIFNEDTKLSVFPTLSVKSSYGEFWRLLNNQCEAKNHFVVGTFGIER